MPGDLFAQEHAVAFLEHEQPRRQCRRRLLRLTHQHDIELQPITARLLRQLARLVKDRTTDRIRSADQLLLLARLGQLILAFRRARLPMAHAKRRVLPRPMRVHASVRLHAQDHQVFVGQPQRRDRRVVGLFSQLCNFVRRHVGNQSGKGIGQEKQKPPAKQEVAFYFIKIQQSLKRKRRIKNSSLTLLALITSICVPRRGTRPGRRGCPASDCPGLLRTRSRCSRRTSPRATPAGCCRR